MNTQSPTAIQVYLARVRSALDDLPPAEVGEILEDVRPHMAELAAELGKDAPVDALIERLGSPEAYAAELRAAGDYPPASTTPTTPTTGGRVAPRLALWSLGLSVIGVGITGLAVGDGLRPEGLLVLLVLAVPLVLGAWYVANAGAKTVGSLPELRRIRGIWAQQNDLLRYLRSLQPAWPLVCVVLCMGLGLLLVLNNRRSGLLAFVFALIFLALIAAAVVWTSQRVKSDPRWLWLHLPAAALVAGGALGLALHLSNAVDHVGYSDSYYPQPATLNGSPALYYGNDSVENLYVFDAQGKPLADVYVYDEKGRPISLARFACEERTGTRRKVGEDNQFPHPSVQQNVTDNSGVDNGYNAYRAACHEQTGVPFSAAIPKGVVPGGATPTPSATSTPPATTTPGSSTKPTG